MSIGWRLLLALVLAGCGNPPVRPSGDGGTDASDDPCTSISCDAPPADACLDAHTLRTFAPVGTCVAGACSYDHSDTSCPHGCSAGACAGEDSCAGIVCNSPPAPSCESATSLATYSSSGTCMNGVCKYTFTESSCPAVPNGAPKCAAGACVLSCDSGYQPSGTSCVKYVPPDFTSVGADSRYNFNGVWGSSPSDIYAVGANTISGQNPALIYHYNGSSWSVQTNGVPAYVQPRAVWGSGPDDVYVVGAVGIGAPTQTAIVLHSTNGGASWTSKDSGVLDALDVLWGSGPGDVYAGGHSEGLLHSTDQGASWSSVSGAIYGVSYAIAMWGSGAGDVYLSDGVALRHSTDGKSFTDTGALASSYQGIWGSGPGDVYAVGTAGSIVHSRLPYWDTVKSGSSANFWGVWGSGPNDLFIVGDDGNIIHSTDGTTWVTIYFGALSPQPLIGVWGSGPRDVYAVGSGTLLHGQ